jgi:hypothetical protein
MKILSFFGPSTRQHIRTSWTGEERAPPLVQLAQPDREAVGPEFLNEIKVVQLVRLVPSVLR